MIKLPPTEGQRRRGLVMAQPKNNFRWQTQRLRNPKHDTDLERDFPFDGLLHVGSRVVQAPGQFGQRNSLLFRKIADPGADAGRFRVNFALLVPLRDGGRRRLWHVTHLPSGN